MAEPRGLPLSARIVALALAAILLTSAISFAITMRGPPPYPAPTRIEELAALLRDGRPVSHAGREVERWSSEVPGQPRPGEEPSAGLRDALARTLAVPPSEVRLYFAPNGPDARGGMARDIKGDFTASLRAGRGWTVARTTGGPVLTQWHLVSLIAMLGAAILLGIVAWIVARAIARPLGRLADAAGAIQVGSRPAPVSVDGPPEVRQVAEAMNAMQDRIAAQLSTRTTILAAIAHDLGTPLTRLAFHIDRLPEAERVKADAEMAEMRAMIGSVIDFARSDPQRMVTEPLDLVALVREAAGDAPVGQQGSVTVSGDAAALRRLFSNLFENAARYGGEVSACVRANEGTAIAEISDRGPGIDPALLPRIFEPFVRGEPSRNRGTGGSGLGLAIVRSIAEAHGGTVALRNAECGLVATVSLPLLK